jgi:hypothetical protein
VNHRFWEKESLYHPSIAASLMDKCLWYLFKHLIGIILLVSVKLISDKGNVYPMVELTLHSQSKVIVSLVQFFMAPICPTV